MLELRVEQLRANQAIQCEGIVERFEQIGLQPAERDLHPLYAVILAAVSRFTPEFIEQFSNDAGITLVQCTRSRVLFEPGDGDLLDLLEQ